MGFQHKCSQREGSGTQNKGRYFNVFSLLNYIENHLSSSDSFPKISDCNRVEPCVFPEAPTEAQIN